APRRRSASIGDQRQFGTLATTVRSFVQPRPNPAMADLGATMLLTVIGLGRQARSRAKEEAHLLKLNRCFMRSFGLVAGALLLFAVSAFAITPKAGTYTSGGEGGNG